METSIFGVVLKTAITQKKPLMWVYTLLVIVGLLRRAQYLMCTIIPRDGRLISSNMEVY